MGRLEIFFYTGPSYIYNVYLAMSAIDILIILIFVGAVIYGFWKGFIVQLGSVGGILLGIVLCRLFGTAVTAWFAGDNPDGNDIYIASVFANVLLFLAGYISARLVARVVKAAAGGLHLTPLDRIAGALFSVFQWFFIFSLLLNILQVFTPDRPITKGSHLANGRAASAIVDFAPKVLGSETAHDLWNSLPPKR